MDDTFLALLIFVLGFLVGWRLSALFNRMATFSILRDLGITEQQLKQQMKKYEGQLDDDPDSGSEEPLTDIEITLEQHQGQIYAFRKDTDAFLGQGKDRDSLIEDLKSKMNNVRLVVVEGNDLIKVTES
jgi:hypothetical protein